MEKLIYLRGLEYVSKEEKELIIKMYGINSNPIPTPYIWFEEKDIFHDSGSGFVDVNEILLTIWNDNSLNDRYNTLIERIKSTNGKFTASKSLYYNYVEESILHNLIIDTCNKYDYLNHILKTTYGYLLSEIKRILQFPIETHKSKIVMDAEICLMKLKRYGVDNLTEVKSKNIDTIINDIFKKRLENKYSHSVENCMRGYFIPLKDNYDRHFYNDTFNKLYDDYPFLCKVHVHKFSDSVYLEINVYDYHDVHKSLKIILNELFNKYNFNIEDFKIDL